MKLTKWLAIAGVITLAAVPAASEDLPFLKNAAGHEKPFTIGVSNGFIGNAWRAQFVADIEAVAAELKADGDVKDVIVVNSTSGANGQITQINSLLSRGIDALVINPVSGEALKPVVARAVAAGVLVVVVDNPLDMPDVLNVPLDHTQYWGIETQWLVETLNGKGNIVAIEGLAGNTANDWRVRARDEVLAKNSDVKLLASVPGQWDQATAREAMTGLLAAHDNIDGVLIQEVMPEGAIRAFTAAGVPLKPMTGDYVHSYLKYWKDTPELLSVVVANPPGVGADALRIATELLRGNTLNTEALVANPINPSYKNTIVVPEPYVIEREANTGRNWCTETTKCISLDEALKLLDGKPDNYSIDSFMSADGIRKHYFK
ncbi:ABC transporter substrate-binding protein [Shinella sp. CPCC 101442]|uniref:ABC transporter substrate-binding protein n=1 Tax=Shinella sp. CPCC 101442 TaxID=2932265 RepID=UPI002152DF39|nr:ABC transporter substrate-binding protein [Shinella sp. CPCC 101442]MCR6497403.1 ABC transporter substrate-binding protein [Shinella sp. CPCC 101442]